MAENQPGVAQQALSIMNAVASINVPEEDRAETYALLEKLAPNLRGNGSPHADNPDQEDAERVRAYRHNALLELKDTEYFNRKAMLTDPKYQPTGAGPINPFISGLNNGLIKPGQMDQMLAGRGSFTEAGPINPLLIGANADFDGNELDWIVPPPPLGFPLDELVNLPRFIMADVAPFAFVNEPQYKPTNLRLPYPKILFELGPEDDRHMVVVSQIGEKGDAFRTEYLHTDQATPFEIGIRHHVMLSDGDTLDIHQYRGLGNKTDLAVAEWTAMAIIGFIAEFSVGNTIIGTQARDPNRVIPAAGTTRKYRIVRVVMGVTKVCKPWQGGTHASPREHERMGHWRRVKGEPRWFPAVTVNKGVIGRVMKEYHVNHRKTTRPVTQGPEA